MKKQILTLSVLMAAIVGTAQTKQNYEIGNPNDKDHYGYLDSYDGLKDYIDHDKYPNFKLGVGVTASEYNKKGTEYNRTNANFTEVVTGNAMKYSSNVKNDGSMDFTTVKTFVKNASAAGQNIYGHTLAWHSQQNTTFLNGLLKDKPADKIDGDTTIYVTWADKDFRTQQSIGWHSDYSSYHYSIEFDATNGLHAKVTQKATNSWDVQYIAMDGISTTKGGNCRMYITVKGSKAGKIHSKLGDWDGGPTADISFTTEWKEVAVEYKSTKQGSFLLLQHGDFVGDIYIREIRFASKQPGIKTTEERRCLVIETDARTSDACDNQLWILTNSFTRGQKYTFTADIRADKPARVSTQVHKEPGTYVGATGWDDLNFTMDWQTVTFTGYFSSGGKSVAFNLSELAEANKYYFDNISLKVGSTENVKNGDLEGDDVSSFKRRAKGDDGIVDCTIAEKISYVFIPNSIPLTAQEKHDTLVWAMDRWIKGIMTACDGKVKAWDVVNEAISGGNADSEGVYALQHGSASSTSDFFWQDYMGDLEYVRQSVRLARKYGPEDVKLFINDYNLESDWDSNGKLKSLIKWIKRWEADGETYIDGIGTQMHISCYMNSNTQTSKKDAIENMFRLMAKSGKLVRISEMDMGMVDASGNNVKTADMTEAMHKKMAELYEWIIKKYLEIIPPEQQWGICQWCATDAPSSSGWRADTPVGLWDLSGYRKHTYAGFVRGLGGKSYAGVPIIPAGITEAPHIYDLLGRPINGVSVSDLPPGIYIIDGKLHKLGHTGANHFK